MREIRMLRATWRGLETWHGRAACRRARPLDPTDERGWETERCRMAQATAPILDFTICGIPLHYAMSGFRVTRKTFAQTEFFLV